MVSPALINAQYTITGTVTNADSEPLKFVRVMISAKESESLIGYTFTDDIGEYSIEIPGNAELMITFSATYYNSETYPINTTNSQDSYTLNTVLQLKPEQLESVVLEHTDSNIAQIINDTIVFDVGAFKKGDEEVVEDLLENIPGVEVDMDGMISFQNKPIEKLMIGGDDLFGKGYSVLSKNMPSYPIKELEVYKNYSNNPLLTGIEDSDKVAMNLVLDEKYKNVWFGNLDLSTDFAIKSRYYFKGVASLIAKKSKHFFLTNFNSIGADAVGGIGGLLKDYDNYAMPLIGLVRQMPEIGRTDYEFNNQEVVSLSSINHLSPKIKLRTLFYLEWDEKDFFQNTIRNYNVQDINLSFTNTENYFLRNKIKTGYGQLKLEYDIGKSDRLESVAYYSTSSYNTFANLIFNEYERKESLGSEYSQFKSNIDYTKKFDESKVLVVNSEVLVDKLPQEYVTNSFFFSDFFQLDKAITGLAQNNQIQMFFTDVEVNFLNRKNSGTLWNFLLGSNYKRDRITSNIKLFSDNSVVQTEDVLENDTDYITSNIYLKGKYLHTLGKKVTIQAIVEIRNIKNTLNSITKNRVSPGLTYINPEFKLNWQLADYNQFDLLYSYYVNSLDSAYLIDNYYLTGYNSLERGGINFPNQLKNSLISLNHELELWDSTMALSSNISYVKNYDYISTNDSFYTDYSVSEGLLVKDQTLFFVSSALDYYMYGPKLNLRLKFGQNRIVYERSLFGNRPESVKVESNNYGIELRKSFWGNYVLLGTEWFQTSYDIGTIYSQYVNRPYLDIFIKLGQKLDTKITSDFTFIEGQDNTNYLFRSETKFQIKENKLSMSLDIRNLFNISNYTTFDLSDVGTTLTQIRLLPRIILLGLKYRI